MEVTHSIVHEYTILYSTRIIQKDKKWNDGVLKYYEFNKKLEIYNEDQNLIGTDFYPNNKSNPITSNFFENGVQFKFTNNKFIIEIGDFIVSYKRDVTKLFKRTNKSQTSEISSIKTETMTLPMIKTEKIIPLPSKSLNQQTNTNIINKNVVRQRRIGLSKTVNRPNDIITKSVIKTENGLPIRHKDTKVTKSTSDKSLDSIKNHNILKKLIHHSTRLLPNARVLPNSSNHFQYLEKNNELNNELNNDQLKSSDETNEGDTKVKYEPGLILDSGKSINEADIIHDLSELEEDENFFEMLKDLRDNQRRNKF